MRGELGAARHVVRMRMRVRGVGDLESADSSRIDMRHRDAGRIDHERLPIAEVHQIGGVHQALVHEVHDLHAGVHLSRTLEEPGPMVYHHS